MENKVLFSYRYSAAENAEVQEIRKKYLPKEANKLEELKKLDRRVQEAGILESLILGIGSYLVFGFGMCLGMKVIGDSMVLGIIVGIIGAVGMIVTYPLYRAIYKKAKEKFAPRILQLSSELTGEDDNGKSEDC